MRRVHPALTIGAIPVEPFARRTMPNDPDLPLIVRAREPTGRLARIGTSDAVELQTCG